MTKDKSSQYSIEELRIRFDKSMNDLPFGISGSIMMLAISIDHLIKNDISLDNYNDTMNIIHHSIDRLNSAINDLDKIYKEYYDLSEEEKI